MDVLGIDYTMKSEVIMNLVSDRYALPGLRNKYNVYGFSYTSDPNGIYMCSYRDPNVKETMDFYKGLGGSMRSDNISQDDIDRYILNTYSSFTMPRGELHDSYWAAADYTNGTTSEVKASMMHDMKSVTKDDIMTYADVFDSLYENGSIYTAGSREQIESNAALYDEIVEPFGDIIVVMDGDVFIPDTDIYIEDGVTMVPMRDIFEKLGAQVSWNGDSRTVTAVKDDKTICFAIGSNEISVSEGLYEETVNSERDIAISNDRTMIPLRLIAQLFGYEVEWNEEGQYISIV